MPAKTVVVVKDLKTLLAQTNTEDILLQLPHRLRLVRDVQSDNGFSGVRSLTSEKAFLRDLLGDEAMLATEGIAEKVEKLADGGPAMQTEVLQELSAQFNAIKAGEFMVISPGASAKYLVCNPRHHWVAAVQPLAILLASATSDQIAKKQDIIPTEFASLA